jgi:hypothetical protein
MPNPYTQVMLTYLRHPFSSVKQLFITMVILLFNASIFLIDSWILQFYLFLFIALFTYWAIHVKEQFADSRASLTPGFRKTHGVVALLAGMVFVILLPGVIALLIGRQPLGLVSITTFLFGIIFWAVLRLGKNSILLFVAVLISTLFEPIRNGIEKIVSGNEPAQAFIIISIGIILSITGFIRLFLLNEEKPEYHLNLKFPIDGRIKLSDLQWQKLKKSYSRGLRGWFTNRTVVKMIYHARHATDPYWSRIQRWNFSGFSACHALLLATLINLSFTLISFVSGTNSPPMSATRIFMATFMPVFLVNKQFEVKSRFMAQDLMMPVIRDAYLKQVGISFATSHFILWGGFLTVSVLWIFTESTKPSPELLIFFISYSLMIQIWLFGFAIWVLSFRSINVTILIMFIAAILSAMPISVMPFTAQAMIQWRHFIMPLGCLLGAIGLLLAWWGYRRWVVVDLV